MPVDSDGLASQALFTRGTNGYHTYRIPSLITTPSGTVLAFCEGRRDAVEDSGHIDLVGRRSADGGATWSEQQVVWSDSGNTCGNPCPVVDELRGRIVLLATWNRGDDRGKELHIGTGRGTRRVYMLESSDDGRTWSDACEITSMVKADDWWWYATGPGIGIQLRSDRHAGRLVIPANHTSANDGYAAHAIYSDDGGSLWRRSAVIGPACNESQVVELADGRLMMNMRSQSADNSERTGYRAISYSSDGGVTWAVPVFDDELGDPMCQASLIRYSLAAEEDRNRLLFSNPSPPISPEPGERIRMTVRMSHDEGQTWPVRRLIHAGPAAYSCLARLPDGSIGLLYESGGKGPYEQLTLVRFPLESLTDGRSP